MSCYSFIHRKFNNPLKYNFHKEFEGLSYNDPVLGDLNDEKYKWRYFGFDKYGRYAVCENTKIKRSLTMGEFYGTSAVD